MNGKQFLQATLKVKEMMQGDRGDSIIRLVEKYYTTGKMTDAINCYKKHVMYFNDMSSPIEKFHYTLKNMMSCEELNPKNFNSILAFIIPVICYNSNGMNDLLSCIKWNVCLCDLSW